jgi:CRISPR-associated protein Cmr3
VNLFLEPTDVWLFRDGRSFDAFSDHRAASLFPPYPTVVQGAIRSHHLIVAGVDLRDRKAIVDAVGTGHDVGNLRLRGPFLARRDGERVARYFPQPADAVSVTREPPTLRPASPPEVPSATLVSVPTPRLLGVRDQPAKVQTDLWLLEDDLGAYLKGRTVAAVCGRSLFLREVRSGIGRDDAKRTTREGALYEAEFIRVHPDVGLLVEMEGYDGWPKSGIMRIGGEGRGARFEQVTAASWPVPPDPLPRRFKVYFATPTFFAAGWLPEHGGWTRYFEGDAELVAAAVGRYESVGGFDVASRSHKPARRYVPAGSVYYFESSGQTRLRPDLLQRALTDWGAEIGFGQIVVEEW